MERILRKNGKVFLVKDFDKKGFETYEYLGLDSDTISEKSKKKENKKEVDE